MGLEEGRQTYIDFEAGLGRVRGNRTLYRRMLGLFLESAEFEALDAALAAGDMELAAKLAHTIKGMTGNLGFVPLYEASAELVVQLRAGGTQPQAVQAYRQALEGTCHAVRQLARQMETEPG